MVLLVVKTESVEAERQSIMLPRVQTAGSSTNHIFADVFYLQCQATQSSTPILAYS
jgi:hypothetical protein